MKETRITKNHGKEECPRFAQAVLFLGQELDLPVKIPCGAGSSEERAMEMLATLSENLISEANSTVIINDEDEVVFIRLSPPESLNLKAGDIVAPPPIIVGRRSNWLARISRLTSLLTPQLQASSQATLLEGDSEVTKLDLLQLVRKSLP